MAQKAIREYDAKKILQERWGEYFGDAVVYAGKAVQVDPETDWDRLKSDGYRWWVDRMRAALELFDLVRMDHFRGFEAFWEVPAGESTAVNGRWVKATPAFNASLCERLGVNVLEFDGSADSLFQPFDRSGRRHMEYLLDRGTYADVPFETIRDDFRAHYPALMSKHGLAGDFQAEAVAIN